MSEVLTPAIAVNPKKFGIEENKALELISNLPQIIEERSALETQYAEIVKMDIEDAYKDCVTIIDKTVNHLISKK